MRLMTKAIFAAAAAVPLVMVAQTAAANGSCNGRGQMGTSGNNTIAFFHGGSHLAGETTTWTVPSGSAAPPAVLTITPEGSNEVLCSGTACDGFSFTAPSDGDFTFRVETKAAPGSSFSIQAFCLPNMTGVDDDADQKGDNGDTSSGGDDTASDSGSGSSSSGSSGSSQAQSIAQRLSYVGGAIQSARLPGTIPGPQQSTQPMTIGQNAASFFWSSDQAALPQGVFAADSPGVFDDTFGVPSTSPFNIWVQGRITAAHGDVSDLRGEVFEGRLGLGYAFTPALTAGIYVSGLAADVRSVPLATEVRDQRLGGGLYATALIADMVSASAQVSYEQGEADITASGATGSADVERIAASISVSGTFNAGAVDLSPYAQAGYVNEERDAYVDSLGRAIVGDRDEYAHGALGLRVSRRFEPAEGGLVAVSPFVDGAVHAFSNTATLATTVGGRTISDGNVWGVVSAGVEGEMAGGGTVSFSAGMTGIGNDSRAFFGQFGIRIPFQ